MRICGTVRSSDKILRESILDLDYENRRDVRDWADVIGEICLCLDLARPVMLKKHISDLLEFGRVVFHPDDFMETVTFKRFVIEIFPEKKEKA